MKEAILKFVETCKNDDLKMDVDVELELNDALENFYFETNKDDKLIRIVWDDLDYEIVF